MTAGVGLKITEAAGDPVPLAQLQRLCNRYYWCKSFVAGREVLEVGCGTGQGLGYLQRHARLVIGADRGGDNLAVAHATYESRIPLARLDAHALPFRSASLDVVVLLEAIYFFDDPDRFVAECRRVLRPRGVLLLSAINRHRPDYNPHHVSYRHHFGVTDLAALVQRHEFAAECYGTDPLPVSGVRDRLIHQVQRLVRSLRLIPQGKRGKTLLKRLLFGRLYPIPREITEDSSAHTEPVRIPTENPDRVHLAILCAARLS